MAFEAERTDDGYVIKRGSKGKAVTITQEQGETLYDSSVGILRIVKLPDVDEVYQAFQTFKQYPDVVKVKVVKGYVTQMSRKPTQLDLPEAE